MSARVAARALAAALIAAAGAVRAGDLPAEDEARRRGPALLPEVLARVEDPDPDLRLRARRLARRIALDYYEARAPAGMRLIPGELVVTRDAVRCEGGFYLGVHEVSLEEFRAFLRREGIAPRRCWSEGEGSLPVTNVSLEEARAYARSRGARLPTLDELARAARGGGRLRYPWGERFDASRVNCRESGLGGAEPVGSREGGISVDGITDLLGNVAEWTETRAGKSERLFLAAGGSFRSPARPGATATYRLEPIARLPDVGFRLAKSLPPLPSVSSGGP